MLVNLVRIKRFFSLILLLPFLLRRQTMLIGFGSIAARSPGKPPNN
jgi:hypothetical protein